MAIITQNFSVTPANIIVNNIKPGMEYRTFLFFSTQNVDKSTTIRFSKDGEMAPMIEISPSVSVENIITNKYFKVPITIRIPKEINPSTYKGTITSLLSNNIKNDSGMTVASQMANQIPVQINISDRDYKNISVSNIDFVSGLTKIFDNNIVNTVINIKINTTNNGNLTDKLTKLELTVYNQTENNILAILKTENLPTIPPFSANSSTVNLYGKLPTGSYAGIIRAYSTTQNKPIYNQKLQFNISTTTKEIGQIAYMDIKNRTATHFAFIGIVVIVISIFLSVFIKQHFFNKKRRDR